MIRYWLMPVQLHAWKQVGVFQFPKKKQNTATFDVHAHTKNPHCIAQVGTHSRDNLNLNFSLCTVVGTIWCGKHAGTVTAAPLRNKSERRKKRWETERHEFPKFGSFSVWSAEQMQLYFSGICLSLSCAINSVCISLFPLSVNERYTCLWKCTPCDFLSFPGSVLTHSLNM